MDITLARTFLTVSESGSFIDAARHMNVTQSTVSARIRVLEEQLGRPLFERSHTGADLTAAGEQFRKHALALVRVWQHAQLEVRLSGEHRDHLAVGAQMAFWQDFLLDWIGWLRNQMPDIAVSAMASGGTHLIQRLLEGTLDLAVLYQPTQPPGLQIEHLYDETFVLVTSTRSSRRRRNDDYVAADWGGAFLRDHAAAFPHLETSGLHLDVGAQGVEYLLKNEASCYCPRRLVKHHVARGRLRQPLRARKFVYPVFVVYPESRDEEAYEPILEGLRRFASKLG
jgi:LysR family transcriptional regulator, flagellar master operon regulator